MSAPLEIRAVSDPRGHRIDLEWVRPDPEAFPGMRIVRRRDGWPAAPDDGDVLVSGAVPFTVDPDGRPICRFRDDGLAGETVYYYLLVPFSGSPTDPDFLVDERNRTAAMATAPYGYGERMAALLPAVYHRFDGAAEGPDPELLAPEDRGKGPLRRFLDLAGSQLDQLHSMARSALDLHDPDRVDGRLLPLLANWIGWPVDHRLGIRAQRFEIRRAPYIYRTVGIVPTVEATVKRILGLESRVKEMGDNVALSNHPPRRNLWLAERDGTGAWVRPAEPLSLHAASEGRPAAVTDGDGTLWLFFHTRRQRSQVKWSGVSRNGTPAVRRGEWDIWLKTRTPEDGWTGSQPLTEGPEIDKHPSAAVQRPAGESDTLWVFWDTWSEEAGTFRLGYRTRRDGAWTPRQELWPDDGVERRRPQTVADAQGGLWLFWQEKTAKAKGNVKGRWQVRYTRHDGVDWDPLHRDLRGPLETDPRVEDDLFVLFGPASRLWAFWARRDHGAGGRWRIAYRVKADLDPAAWNWGPVGELPAADPDADDREPSAVAGAGGEIELFWSSDRDRSWSVWRTVLDPASLEWGAPEALTGNPFSQRAPLVAGGGLLFYYSDESLTYESATYSATRTVDGRYAGSTTADARNAAKAALRGTFRDFQGHTFDAGSGGRRGEKNWYAHDTVALYVTPSSEDPSVVLRQRYVLQRVLAQFLPIQVRVVQVIEPPPFQEAAYTYDFPGAQEKREIGEQVFDSTLPETLGASSDGYADLAPGWVWIRSTTPDHKSVDFTTSPVDTSRRTWHVGLSEGPASGDQQ